MQKIFAKQALLKAVESLDQAAEVFRLFTAEMIRDGKRAEAEKLLLQADAYDRFIYSVCEVKVPKGDLH